MDLETLTLDVSEGIATVILNRAPVNAQNRQMREEIVRVFDALSDRDDVRVVVLSATGKAFCAGADIKERRGMAPEAGAYLAHNRLTRESFWVIADCAKPVICVVQGAAIGAGFAIMLAADIMLASDNAWFQMPEIDVGLAGAGRMVEQAMGKSNARLAYFTARRIPAAELYRMGVISGVHPAETLMDEAMTIAREIAAKNPRGVPAVKRGFQVAESLPYREAYRYEQGITHALSTSEETRNLQADFGTKKP